MNIERDFDPKEMMLVLGGDLRPRFPMGDLVITRNAHDSLDRDSWMTGLRRHLTGDWGELDEEDRWANDEGLREGGRLFSAFRDASGCRFWIITECDRSVTTILMPQDY